MGTEKPEWYDLEQIPTSLEPTDILAELAHRTDLDVRMVLSHAQLAQAMGQKQGYDLETIEELIDLILIHLGLVIDFNKKVKDYLVKKRDSGLMDN